MHDLRVAFFLPQLAGGGSERVAVNLAAEYQKLGVKIDFVLAKAEGVFIDSLPSNAKVVDLKTSRVLFALPRLVHYLRQNKPDAVFSAPNHTHIILLLAKLISGSSTRTMLHIGNHVSTLRRTSKKIQEKIYPALLWLLQGYANAIIAVSEGVADDLTRVARIPRHRITVIHNPIYRPEMETLMEQPVEHAWLAKGQPPVILAVGRLVEQKDYPTLLHAFAHLRKNRIARLIILGEGKLLPDLKALSGELNISNDVDFAGFDPNPYRYMARSNVFVLSSAWEGFANVVAEALACGAQVVSTNCESGPAEILMDGTYGHLVPISNFVAMANAMAEALDHPKAPYLLRQRGIFFSAKAAADQYLQAAGINLI
jgi:glycosyltransferase involved in cell wall biosynthesis